MGLFDDITCEMPLPECPEWATNFQTKDTPSQYMDRYCIREDGTLWVEEYDIEDHSDPDVEGLMRLAGMMTRVNKRWEKLADFDGAVDFYAFNHGGDKSWVEYRVVFVDGRVVKGPVLLSPLRGGGEESEG